MPWREFRMMKFSYRNHILVSHNSFRRAPTGSRRLGMAHEALPFPEPESREFSAVCQRKRGIMMWRVLNVAYDGRRKRFDSLCQVMCWIHHFMGQLKYGLEQLIAETGVWCGDQTDFRILGAPRFPHLRSGRSDSDPGFPGFDHCLQLCFSLKTKAVTDSKTILFYFHFLASLAIM